MKLTTFILIAFCVHVSGKSISQTITFSGKNISLEKVFEVIRQQTEYLVIYNPVLLKNAGDVNIEVSKMPLLEFLDKAFDKKGLGYIIENKTIVVKAEKKRLKSIVAVIGEPPVT